LEAVIIVWFHGFVSFHAPDKWNFDMLERTLIYRQ
jgi:hypothetical protein